MFKGQNMEKFSKVVDSQFYNLPESFDDITFINEAPAANPEPSKSFEYGVEIEDTSLNMALRDDVVPLSLEFGTLVQSLDDRPDIECRDDHEFESVFECLNQILMEESMDEKPDHLALEATEKSFYDVIDEKDTPSPYIDMNTECPNSLYETTCETNGNSVGPSCDDPGLHEFWVQQFNPSNRSIQSSFISSQPLVNLVNGSRSNYEGQVDSFMNVNLISSQLSDSESKLQFWKGMEEARKFLPTNSELVIDLDNSTLASKQVKEPREVVVRIEKDHSTSIRERKHLHHQDSDLDTRSSKQRAVYKDEIELSEMLDNLFLRDFKGVTVSSKGDVKLVNGIDQYLKQNQLPRVQRNGKVPSKEQGEESNPEYLQCLILSCAQAAAYNDLPDAHEQLKQIRQYASSTGDAYQRVANIFADGLEARLTGTGTQMHAALASSKKISAFEMLKAHQAYLSACPFLGNTITNINKMILKTVAKGSTLHIVDFGISYGFLWLVPIQFLSIRRGGPPKLRITGIDFPQTGFRPSELIKQTGQRLANYCKRFNVPFEYQAISRQSWEKIDINDLKLERNEVLVVNCFFKFQNLPEETVLAERSKDGILKLIRSMKPDLFTHSIVNASHNASFFLTRFREAFFHYASHFDMLDATLPRNDLQRMYMEKEYFACEVVNIVACEGEQRVVRPETYKQWHLRSMKAGFKSVPLEREVILKAKLEVGYHKDFLFEEDCNWMLQGWKGRVLYGTSCWVPV